MSGSEVLAVVACVATSMFWFFFSLLFHFFIFSRVCSLFQEWTLVDSRPVVSAYQDGISLMRKVKRHWKARKKCFAGTPARNLEDSLALGPLAIQGQYDNDFRRFGQKYAQGDRIAGEQMKDIIINLQMALLMNLRVALVDDVELDFGALQLVSDKNRVDAVMALCQLYQRMASAAPILAGGINAKSAKTPCTSDTSSLSKSPSLSSVSEGRSSYASTASSTTSHSGQLSIRRENGPLRAKSSVNSLSAAFSRLKRIPSSGSSRRMSFFGGRTSHSRSSSNGSGSSQRKITVATNQSTSIEHEEAYSSRPIEPRTALERYRTALSWPQQQKSSHANYNNNNFPWSTNTTPLPTPSITKQSEGFFSPDALYSHWNQQREDNDNGTCTTQSDRPLLSPINTRHHQDFVEPDRQRSIEVNHPNAYTPTFTTLARRVHTPSPAMSIDSNNSTGSGTIPPPFSPSLRLYVPSEENNFAGFCKGAWKMQLGLKKAFSVRTRADALPFTSTFVWRCSKCSYEGPIATGDAIKKPSSFSSSSSSIRSYDTTVRTHAPTGISYRWAFLAKSHVFTTKKLQSRTDTGTKMDGSTGVFGCIFCCAEQRGPAPTFGNLDTFMEHLLGCHRAMRPHMEVLLDRTRCVVGRVADFAEDFDVNIPPSSIRE